MNNTISDLRDDSGQLPAYAWPGGYPILYLDKDNNVLCPDCANAADCDPEPTGWFIHYEGTPVYCDDCGNPTESTYGDLGIDDATYDDHIPPEGT